MFQTPSEHIAMIAAQYGVTWRDVMGKSRYRQVSLARQHCYWFFRERDRSYPEIARLLKRKDHTTVIYGRKRHMARNGILEGTALPYDAGYSAGLI